MRFTKNRNSATDLGATEWTFLTQGQRKRFEASDA